VLINYLYVIQNKFNVYSIIYPIVELVTVPEFVSKVRTRFGVTEFD